MFPIPYFLLSIDIGSTSIKGMIWKIQDGHHVINPIIHSKYSILSPSINTTLQDELVQRFIVGVKEMIQYLMKFVDDNRSKVMLGLSCFAMSLIGIDFNGHPVTPLITYSSPNPPSTNVLTNIPLPIDVGVPDPFHPSYALVHILYYYYLQQPIQQQQQQPIPQQHLFQSQTTSSSPINHIIKNKIYKFITLSSYIISQLFGVDPTTIKISLSEASWWGLLNSHNSNNDPHWTPKLPQHIIELLPSIAMDSLILHDDKQTLSHVFTFADGATAQIGAAPISNLVVTVGTSSAARVAVEHNQLIKNIVTSPTQLGCFQYRITKDLYLIGGALNDGGNVLDFAEKLLVTQKQQQQQHPTTTISNESPPIPSPSLIVLPFFTRGGERATGWHGQAMPGAIIGLTETHSARDVKEAFVIGICLRLRDVVNRLEKLQLLNNTRVAWATGNALLKNSLWNTTLSASLNRQIIVNGLDDTMDGLETLRGIMILVMKELGLSHNNNNNTEKINNYRIVSTISNNKEISTAYEMALQKQIAMMDLLVGHYSKL
jgi:gluconokinase